MVIYRLQDLDILRAGMAEHIAYLDCPLGEMLHPRNIILTDDNWSFAVFEHTDIPGCYAAHHFHPRARRGKDALAFGRAALKFLFATFPQVKTLRGYTENHRKDALWAARQLGFTSHGGITYRGGPGTLFILTRRDFEGGL